MKTGYYWARYRRNGDGLYFDWEIVEIVSIGCDLLAVDVMGTDEQDKVEEYEFGERIDRV